MSIEVMIHCAPILYRKREKKKVTGDFMGRGIVCQRPAVLDG